MIGIGFDIHRLVKGRPLFLGGLKIPYPRGLLGHSDGDVLLHSICDAILGAAGLGDIGDRFPDTDPKYKNYPSAEFIKEILRIIARKRLKVVSLDTIIFAETPKLGRLKPKIRLSLARLLRVSARWVNVKAKTMEKLGPIGAKRALAALTVVSVKRHR